MIVRFFRGIVRDLKWSFKQWHANRLSIRGNMMNLDYGWGASAKLTVYNFVRTKISHRHDRIAHRDLYNFICDIDIITSNKFRKEVFTESSVTDKKIRKTMEKYFQDLKRNAFVQFFDDGFCDLLIVKELIEKDLTYAVYSSRYVDKVRNTGIRYLESQKKTWFNELEKLTWKNKTQNQKPRKRWSFIRSTKHTT